MSIWETQAGYEFVKYTMPRLVESVESLTENLKKKDTFEKAYINNRPMLHHQLSELQADFEDLTDEELISCKESIKERINICLKLIIETDEDNIR